MRSVSLLGLELIYVEINVAICEGVVRSTRTQSEGKTMIDSSLIEGDRNGAVLSADGVYRYRLWRTWDASKPTLAFLMLNPSTADATEDDPTIRRCLGFAKEWGYGSLVVVNLFALRSPNPDALRENDDPVGPENGEHLQIVWRKPRWSSPPGVQMARTRGGPARSLDSSRAISTRSIRRKLAIQYIRCTSRPMLI